MNVLEARNITKNYGHVIALDNVSLSIPPSTIVGLVGPNGSGKTTFVNLATGFSNLDSGDLFLKGDRINGRHPHEISRLGIARTFQETRVFRKMTVIENLLVASRDRAGSRPTQKARDLLTLVGLAHLEREYSGNLSYGQQKLLEFARVLMMDPTLILLDEPTAGIDTILTGELLRCFKMLRDQGKTLIIVEHNMAVINAVCERTVVLHHGRKIAEGTPLEIQQNRIVQDAYLGGA